MEQKTMAPTMMPNAHKDIPGNHPLQKAALPN